MNLRDLIFSQSQNDSAQPSQQLATIGSNITEDRFYSSALDYNDIADTSNINSSPEDKKRKRSRYRVHYTAPYPDPSERKPPLYRECPEVKFVSSLVQPCSNTPGLSVGLKFPKNLFATSSHSGRPTFANGLRILIREIWNISFLAKDFQLASMALSLLSEVGSITASDIRAAGELLRYSDQSISQRSGNANMETTPITHQMNDYNADEIESDTTAATNIRKLVLGLLRANDTKDLDSVGISTELLLGLGDAKAAQMVLQKSSRRIASANTHVYYCLDAIIVIFKTISFTLKISSLLGLNAFIPSLRQVCEDPLQFYRCVHVVRIVAEGGLTFDSSSSSAKKKHRSRLDDKASSLRQCRPICRQLINELKSTFRVSVVNPITKIIEKRNSESNNHDVDSDANGSRQDGYKRTPDKCYDCVELTELYAAYLVGLGQEKMAATFLRQCMAISKPSAVNEDKGDISSKTVASKYMILYAKYIARFHCSKSLSSNVMALTENAKLFSAISDHILPTLENWVQNNCSSNAVVGPSLKLLAVGLILYRLNRLKKSKLLSIVTSALENLDSPESKIGLRDSSHSPQNFRPNNNKIRSNYHPLHWLLWRLLSVDILGKLPSCSDDEPVRSDSEILRHLPRAATRLATNANSTDRLHPADGFGYLSGRFPLHSASASSTNSSQSITSSHTARYCSAPLRKESIQQKFRRCCEWWKESLLSSSYLGELRSTVMEFEAAAYLDGLPQLIDDSKQVKELPTNIVMNNFMNYQRNTSLFHDASSDAYHKCSQMSSAADSSTDSDDGHISSDGSDGEAHEKEASLLGSDLDKENVESHKSTQIQDKSLLYLLSIAVDFSESDEVAAAPQYLDMCYRTLVESTVLMQGYPNKQLPTCSDTSEVTAAADDDVRHGLDIDSEDSYFTWKIRLSAFIPQHIKELYHRHLHSSTNPSVAEQDAEDHYDYRIAMDLSEGKDKFAKKRILASAVKNTLGHAPYETVLGNRVLEILAFQAIVSAHLSSQDNLFTIRAVQIICLHALRVDINFQRSPADDSLNNKVTSAGYCLRMMVNAGINVVRAIRIGTLLACENSCMTLTAPPSYHLLDPSEVGFNVAGGESSYDPVG